MRLKLMLFGLVSIPLAAQISQVPFSESKEVVPAFDSNGVVTLPAARLKLDISYPQGKQERCELTVVYDSRTGHYVWHHMEPAASIPDGFRLSIIKAQMVAQFADTAGLVEFGFGDSLAVKVGQGRADTLDAAVSKSIDEIRGGLAWYERGNYHKAYKLIPVFGSVFGFDAKLPSGLKPIPPGFRCEPNRSFCPGDGTITSISKQGSNWRLLLRDRWDEEVILDKDFNIISMQQLTQPAH